MDIVTKVSKLTLSVALLLLALSAFVFVLKYDSAPAQGVGIYKEAGLAFHNVYTQSADGRTMYRWHFNKQARRWEAQAYTHR